MRGDGLEINIVSNPDYSKYKRRIGGDPKPLPIRGDGRALGERPRAWGERDFMFRALEGDEIANEYCRKALPRLDP